MADPVVMQFQADLEAFHRALQVTLATAVRRIALDLHTRIVLRTPVKTGRARGSWGISLDVPGDYVLPPGEYGAGVAAATAQQQALTALSADAPFRTVYLFNNLPYIEVLEGGSSQQSPHGMVAVSMAEIEAEIDSVLEATARAHGLQ